jgi:hypothetical protein
MHAEMLSEAQLMQTWPLVYVDSCRQLHGSAAAVWLASGW